MSKQKSEKNHELARVLARIDVLMKHGEQSSSEVTVNDTVADIPVLTEVYEGQPVTLGTFMPMAAAIPDQPGEQNERIEPSRGEATQLAETEAIEELLAGMQPIIQEAIREAVQLELAEVEQTLCKKLEVELTQNLREHLQAKSS